MPALDEHEAVDQLLGIRLRTPEQDDDQSRQEPPQRPNQRGPELRHPARHEQMGRHAAEQGIDEEIRDADDA